MLTPILRLIQMNAARKPLLITLAPVTKLEIRGKLVAPIELREDHRPRQCRTYGVFFFGELFSADERAGVVVDLGGVPLQLRPRDANQ